MVIVNSLERWIGLERDIIDLMLVTILDIELFLTVKSENQGR
jgi:hypothetical protein